VTLFSSRVAITDLIVLAREFLMGRISSSVARGAGISPSEISSGRIGARRGGKRECG
jgi:hypothetical protein